MSALIFLGLTTIFVGILSYYLWIWTYWKRRGVPAQMGRPLIGTVFEMHDHDYPPYVRIRDWAKTYGKVFGITEGAHRTLVIGDAKLVQEVFVKQYDNFYGRKLNSIQGDPEKDKRTTLFSAQGHRWKRLRTISSPTFSSGSLRKLKDTVEDCAFELLVHIENNTKNGEAINMLDYYQEFTLDVIGKIAMGQHESKMFHNPMMEPVKAVFGEGRKHVFMLASLFPPFGKLWRFLVMQTPLVKGNPVKEIAETCTQKIEERIRQREEDAKKGIEDQEPQDFIDLFLDARADPAEISIGGNDDFSKTTSNVDRKLTVDEIVGQCFVFLVAGFDTTALSLSYSTYLLATNPEKMKKLQEEIDRECPDDNITFDQLSKMKYLECVVKETLRLYPLGSLANARRCMRPTKIGDLEIEKGTDILVNTWALHYDREYWGENVEEFVPERWETDQHSMHSGNYVPFGFGPRQCIGMRLAYMEEKLLLSHLLKRYSFETCEKTSIPLKLVGRSTTQPEDVWLKLRSRY